MPEHTSFKIGKLLKYRVIGRRGQHSAIAIEISIAPATPRAFG